MRTLLLLGLLAIAGNLPATSLPPLKVSLSGTLVTDGGAPLEYATVSALAAADSTLVDGTVTDAAGAFSLSLERGEYVLKVEFIGYATKRLPVRLNGRLDLGEITLAAGGVALETVEVRAEKSQMNLHLDKKVFNVGADALAQGGSVNELLAQVPSVAVSAEGTVSLRGNPSVTILINGRPSALARNGGLQGIPAASIERIEVITNPSARYEAAGTAGILNIILKKETERGYGGSLRLASGYPANHQALLNLNYRHKKFNGFANLGGRYSNYRGRGDLTRTSTLEGETTSLAQIPTMDRNDRAWSGYAGFDYHLDDKTTVTASYSIYDIVNDDLVRNRYDYAQADGTPLRTVTQTEDYFEPGLYHQVDLIYAKEISADRELTFRFNHDAWKEPEFQDISLRESFPQDEQIVRYRTTSRESSKDFLFQGDYKTSVGEHGRFETGLRAETRIIVSDYIAESRAADSWSALPGFANRLDYYERIGSAYAQYAYQRERFGLQLGLRNEYTIIKAENSVETGGDTEKTYNRVFPSASAKYDLTEATSSQLSYSRRIRRPGFGHLNPFGGIRNPTSIFSGNPDLDPAYTDRIEWNLVATADKLTVNPALYAARTLDLFQYLVDQAPENLFGLNDGTIFMSPVNLDRQHEYGFELTLAYRPHEVIDFNGNFHYRGYQERGTVAGRNFDFDFATWSANFRVQANLPGEITAQAQVDYDAREKDVQTERVGRFGGTAAISKRWGERVTASVNVFAPRYFRVITTRPTFRQDDYFQWTGWRLGASIQYNFEKGADSGQRRQRGSIR